MLQFILLFGLIIAGFLDSPWSWIIPGAGGLMLLSALGGQWQLMRTYHVEGGATFFARLPAALLVSAVQWLVFAGAAFTIGKLAGWLIGGLT